MLNQVDLSPEYIAYLKISTIDVLGPGVIVVLVILLAWAGIGVLRGRSTNIPREICLPLRIDVGFAVLVEHVRWRVSMGMRDVVRREMMMVVVKALTACTWQSRFRILSYSALLLCSNQNRFGEVVA